MELSERKVRKESQKVVRKVVVRKESLRERESNCRLRPGLSLTQEAYDPF